MRTYTREELVKAFQEDRRLMIAECIATCLWWAVPQEVAIVRTNETIDYMLRLQELVGTPKPLPPLDAKQLELELFAPITEPPPRPIETDVLPLPPNVITPGVPDVLPR